MNGLATAEAVTDAVVLLRTGRPGMALTVLERLEEAAHLQAETRELAGRIEGQYRELDRLAEKRLELRPATPAHQQLIRALATGRITLERGAELLHMVPADVPAIACGRVGISAGSWRLLLRELEGAA